MADKLPLIKRRAAPKFVEGALFESIGALTDWIFAGKWVYLHRRAVHPAWAMNWSAFTLRAFCRSGYLRKAEINPNWEYETKKLLETYDK